MEDVKWSQEQMLEISLKEPDDFLKVRETLSRIGVASRKEKKTISILSYTTQAGEIFCCAFQRTLCAGWKANQSIRE